MVLVLSFFLLLPTVSTPRWVACRIECRNQLKQIGLALHNYHDEYGRFPPAYTVDAEGRPLHSWRTLLLPYLDERELYSRIDLSKPWDDPVNLGVYPPSLRSYQCPELTDAPGKTTYLAIVTPESALRPGASCNISDITDGSSNTLLVIDTEAAHAVPWMAPHDADERLVQGFGPRSKLQHRGSWLGLFADGTVQYLSPQLSSDIRRTLITIAGNDTPDPLELMPPSK